MWIIISNLTKKIIRKEIIVIKQTQARTDVQSVMTSNTEKGLGVQLPSTNVKSVISLVTSVACATRKMKLMKIEGPWSTDHPRHIN